MNLPRLTVSIFGLGYVGSVTAACLAARGYSVIGVDSQKTKVSLLNNGEAPVIEKGLSELIGTAVRSRVLRATLNGEQAIRTSDITFVSVGTPSQKNGDLNLESMKEVCVQIGHGLRLKKDFHVVVVRSTVLPGTTHKIIIPTLEKYSRKEAGKEFGVAVNPEFLREGTAINDFNDPPKTVIGFFDDISRERLVSLYAGIDAPMIETSVESAEMVKYIDNTWHALKVAFGNEVGNIAKALDIDSHEIMDIFCKDTKLNLSPYYLKPGFAFGGSCLPKDVRALVHKARTLDLELPVINSILPSNRGQIERGIQFICEKGQSRIGILGFSFKAGTDDLRESPMVEVIERLLGKGYDLRLYDKNVNLAKLVGANREYIIRKIPHISSLMVDTIQEVLDHGELIVIGADDEEFRDLNHQVKPGQRILDMIRIPGWDRYAAWYEGINW